MTPESRRWIDAAAILGRDPAAKVLCPACGQVELEVSDVPLGEDRLARGLSCSSCAAYNELLMSRESDERQA